MVNYVEVSRRHRHIVSVCHVILVVKQSSVRRTPCPSNLRVGRSSLVLDVTNENLVSLLIFMLSESLFASSQFSKDSCSEIVMHALFYLEYL